MNWIGPMISFAVILQCLESFWIRPWPWALLAREVPTGLRSFVRPVTLILSTRLLAAAVAIVFPNPVAIGAMLVTTWLYGMRWRGTLNGGSDIMTVHILAAWFVAVVFPASAGGAVIYVGLQILLSYLVAGLAKIFRREWRNGQALRILLARRGHDFSSRVAFILSWLTMIFELGFAVGLVAPLPAIVVGVLFHLVNVYVLGLNRFFFVWLAGYPALVLMFMSLKL